MPGKKPLVCLDCVDTKTKELEVFQEYLINECGCKFIRSSYARGRSEERVFADGISHPRLTVRLINDSIQSFLSKERNGKYNLIIPLLFFHFL